MAAAIPPAVSAQHELVAAEYPEDAERIAAVLELLSAGARDELWAIARGGDSWDVRLVACLALEWVDEGLPGCRVARLSRVVVEDRQSCLSLSVGGDGQAGLPVLHSEGLREFLRLARRPCKLRYAREAFTPAEVVAEIRRHVRTTSGVHDFSAPDALDGLPAYEREIVERLIAANVVYWVDAKTPTALFSLIEYPLGTVVLVIKPPGSDLEIEIKRAGVRGPRALDVRYTNEAGQVVPPHHHLHGGSRGDYLRHEATASALLARIHLLAHGQPAPVPRVATLCRIDSVPGPGGEAVPLLTHFSQPDMRDALRAVLPRLEDEDEPSPIPDFLEGRFITATVPHQAILVGTTSLRLDRLAEYLCAAEGTKLLADDLLDEVLDVYEPPPVVFTSYRSYVAAALAHNREAADRAYIDVFAQVGHFWGTLLAVRGSSDGESFVARNTGLRKRRDGAAPRVQWISMDHDALHLAGNGHRHFQPYKTLNSTLLDQAHILGGVVGKRWVAGEVGALKAIYRVNSQAASQGYAAFREALSAAYAHTQQRFIGDPELRALFRPEFVATLREWDRVAADFDPHDVERWRRRTRARLRRRGFERPLVDQYLATCIDYSDVLPWFVRIFVITTGQAMA